MVRDSEGSMVRIRAEFGRLPFKCSHCCNFGHSAHRCPELSAKDRRLRQAEGLQKPPSSVQGGGASGRRVFQENPNSPVGRFSARPSSKAQLQAPPLNHPPKSIPNHLSAHRPSSRSPNRLVAQVSHHTQVSVTANSSGLIFAGSAHQASSQPTHSNLLSAHPIPAQIGGAPSVSSPPLPPTSVAAPSSSSPVPPHPPIADIAALLLRKIPSSPHPLRRSLSPLPPRRSSSPTRSPLPLPSNPLSSPTSFTHLLLSQQSGDPIPIKSALISRDLPSSVLSSPPQIHIVDALNRRRPLHSSISDHNSLSSPSPVRSRRRSRSASPTSTAPPVRQGRSRVRRSKQLPRRIKTVNDHRKTSRLHSSKKLLRK